MSICCCLKTCGDAELNSCFVVTLFTFLRQLLALCFSLGLLGSARLFERSKASCGEQDFEPPCLSYLQVGASFWLLLPSGRLWVSITCRAITTVTWMLLISALALVGLAGGDPTGCTRLVSCSGFFSGIAGTSLIPRSDVTDDAVWSTAIPAAFSASFLICLCSQRGVFVSYQSSASPSTPLELWKHFCSSSHSSRWFFTSTIIVAVWSLPQILEQPISGILSFTFVEMKN